VYFLVSILKGLCRKSDKVNWFKSTIIKTENAAGKIIAISWLEAYLDVCISINVHGDY